MDELLDYRRNMADHTSHIPSLSFARRGKEGFVNFGHVPLKVAKIVHCALMKAHIRLRIRNNSHLTEKKRRAAKNKHRKMGHLGLLTNY